ncbi:phosphotransferase family protein [Nocardia vaccinii]|uniref:phosphotransferase family protein n=1 Tax=Nocardia vaccinii TaxID=1822 RepID=UPI00082F74C3|nr:phosphotransferase family protein [Nocardia vaccinii]
MPRLLTEQLPAALEPILRQRIADAATGKVRNWTSSPRGLATETYLFDFDCGDTVHPLVLRRPPEVALFPDYDLLRQVLMMRRLTNTGLPIPTVRWLDRDDNPLGGPYFIMDRIPGEAPSDYPSYHTAGNYFDADPAGRAQMWWGCVDAIADIHRLDSRALNLDFLAFPQFGDDPIEQIVGYVDAALAWAATDQPPALRRGVAWLRANHYRPEHVTLCWGDARMSNILYDRDLRATGVLDWEIAHLGDHEADLAWMLFLDWACTEFEGHPPAPGTPSRQETIEYYEHRTGMPVGNLVFNEILAAVLLSIPLLRMAHRLQLPPDLDPTAFCAARIEQLLHTTN